MSKRIYIEGGGQSKELHVRCREGFSKLIKNSCKKGKKMPRLVACGGRNSTFDSFTTAHLKAAKGDYIAMIVDSEDPVSNQNMPWNHLANRDGWQRPNGALDEQVLLMATCMETWIACDRPTLKVHYGACLHENALPAQHNIEARHRHDVQDGLERATRDCKNKYQKGKRSFEILRKLNPNNLSSLTSFDRFQKVLNKKL